MAPGASPFAFVVGKSATSERSASHEEAALPIPKACTRENLSIVDRADKSHGAKSDKSRNITSQLP